MDNKPMFKEDGFIHGDELITQLSRAIDKLEEKMKAKKPIERGNSSGSRIIGYGVDKCQRDIAADAVISIARAIKSLKGW